jgi:hypothetical protein
VTTPKENEDLLKKSRLKEVQSVTGESRSLLDELCGSKAAPPEAGDASPATPHLSQPPSGISDNGDGDGSSGGFCWVARAVYGESSPRWLQFRAWLLSDAPAWFRRLYIRHGERVARWITPRERVKSVIRRWMDSVVA